MMKTIISGIYCIENTLNHKRYIGSAVNIQARWAIHVSLLNNGKHHSRHLQRAWNKYGGDSFVFSVLEQCEKSILTTREQFYIDQQKPEYNIAPKAGSNFGIKFSDDVRANMRAAKQAAAPLVTGVLNPFFGKKHSEEARKKMGVNKGRVLPDEQRKSISAGIKAWWDQQTTEARKKRASKIKGNKWNVGKKQPAEVIAKRVEKIKGKPSALRGTHITAEHKAKVAAGVRAFWAKKRQEKENNG
jgi:group I intron endonuclease